MRVIAVLLALLNLSWADSSYDWSAYCRGFCQTRYQDGFARGEKCACIDYYPINVTNRVGVPHRPREPGSHVYDGEGRDHVYDE
jgi:hypothetical protein